MRDPLNGLDEVELSDVIGEIYDCAIDPERWDATLDRLRNLLDCANSLISVSNMRTGEVRFQKAVGIEPDMLARIPEYAAEAYAALAGVAGLLQRSLDEPIVTRRDVGDEAFFSNRYAREWGLPQGLVDSISLHAMRGPDRYAEIAFGRHESVGLITDREIRLMRLLAPHLRRAVIISDLLDQKGIAAERLGQTLDMLSTGVVLVAQDSEILHANRAADQMIRDAAPIASARGKLSVANAQSAAELREIVTTAVRNESAIGAAGIGMSLTGHEGPPATVHVLPIASGRVRSRLEPRGAAAVFVSSTGTRPAVELAPLAETFDLSRAELRVLARLLAGDTLAEAANRLRISRATAKTHLSRIFAKTGTNRQASLIALVTRHLPPISRPDTDFSE